MNILIVEDTEIKAKALARCVRECDPRCEIFHAGTAKDGFAMISGGNISLVLVDIRLPLQLDSTPDESSSIWLIREVQRKLRGNMPLIVGTTQYAESLARVDDVFREYLWTIIFVNSAEERWQRQINYAIRYAQTKVELSPLAVKAQESFDVAIVTALRIPEFEEVVDALGGGDPFFIQETGERWMRSKVTVSGGRELSVIAACADEMGMCSMAALVTRLCIAARPKRLVLTGIMGGNADRVGMSDIIGVEETWDYRAGKITEKGFQADTKSQRCDSKLSNTLRSLLDQDALISMFTAWKGAKPNVLPRVHVGAVACSPAVVADGRVFSDIEAQKRRVLGVEMEAYGCYHAAERLGDIAPEIICIKAVCDLGDKDKADIYQRYCAYLSARTAVRLISDVRFSVP